MWEYKMRYLKYKDYFELTEELNKEGELNWEVIFFKEEKSNNLLNANVLFKRKKEPV